MGEYCVFPFIKGVDLFILDRRHVFCISDGLMGMVIVHAYVQQQSADRTGRSLLVFSSLKRPFFSLIGSGTIQPQLLSLPSSRLDDVRSL